MRLAQLIAFHMHPSECDQCRRVSVLGGGSRPVVSAADCLLSGQFRGAAQLAAAGLHQREVPETPGSFALIARVGRGAHSHIEDTGRLVATARPQLGGSAAEKHARPDFRMPGELIARDLADQYFRLRSCRRRGTVVPGAK
jgi:hypothetical protein